MEMTTLNYNSEASASAGISNLPPKQSIITDDVMKDLCVAKIFKTNTGLVSSINYTSDGSLAVTAASDDQLNVYNCLQGTHLRTCLSKKYGCALATFTHSSSNVLYSSTKVDDQVRYLSLHDNKFIRYFSGHYGQVTTLTMSPQDDMFLTSAMDRTVRLWDLRSPTCTGLLHILEPAVSTFDPEGLVFSFGITNDTIKMYDVRAFEKGPFSTFYLPKGRDVRARWTSMSFSRDGKLILLNTTGPFVYLIDAFHGTLVCEIEGRLCSDQRTPSKLDACFSADDKYVLTASSDGMLLIFAAKDGRPVTNLNPHHPQAMGALKFNPNLLMLTSAANQTAFWLLRNEDGDDDEICAQPRGNYCPELYSAF